MNLLPVHFGVMAVLFVALLWMLRTCAYRYRWLFGGTVSLFLLVLGSTVTQIQWDKINCDRSSEKKVYRGVVQETPVEKEKVMVCKVKTEDRQVLLSVYKDSLSQTLQSGDNILFYGKIRSPHNAGNPYEFDYASYLLRKQISGTAYVYAGYWRVMDKPRVLGIKQQALACRDKIVGCYRQWGFKGEEFAVLSALTVGYKEELSDELRESYSVAGISHVLALSGLHVGILWFLLGYMLRPFCRNRAKRGIDGKFVAIKYTRTHDIPTFGICLGMQCIAIEFARNVLGYADANSREMDEKTPHNVIDIMEEQKAITNMGGTMRLGAYECVLQKGSKAYQAYGQEHIQERHRHRYEFNNDYKDRYEAAGMKCVGINPESDLVEIVEIPALKWFVGTQFHPEYGSTVLNPHPLFVAFVKAAIENEKTTAKG